MIVSSMIAIEIHREVFEDFKTLQNKLEDLKKDFKRVVLKTSRYPVTKSYKCKTREKKNTFTLEYTALKRSNWKNPILSTYCVFTRPEGKYAVAPSLDMNLTTIYPPHFFKRYRERIVKDELASNEDIIRHYFKNDWGFVGAVVNESFESIYHCFEKDDKDEKISFVGATSLGYCFGERQGNTNIVKTIISEEMLFEDQKNTFAKLRKAFQDYNKDRYGTTI